MLSVFGHLLVALPVRQILTVRTRSSEQGTQIAFHTVGIFNSGKLFETTRPEYFSEGEISPEFITNVPGARHAQLPQTITAFGGKRIFAKLTE